MGSEVRGQQALTRCIGELRYLLIAEGEKRKKNANCAPMRGKRAKKKGGDKIEKLGELEKEVLKFSRAE